MKNEESSIVNNSEQIDTSNNEDAFQKMAEEVLANDFEQENNRILEDEENLTSETVEKRAKFIEVEDRDNVYHVEGVLTAENIAEINSLKNKTTFILENTCGLSSDVLSQIDSDRVFFSVKGGLDYEKYNKYNTDNYKERTMMSPKGLEQVVRYFERVESEIDPDWSDVQKCMYAYNCLAVDIAYGETNDEILSKGTAARGLNGILYGELVCAGFAFTFQEMMNRAGIECYYQNRKSKHSYNVVKLNEKYYGMDVTWDNAKGSECKFRNFGYDEHFYEKKGHKNYWIKKRRLWDDPLLYNPGNHLDREEPTLEPHNIDYYYGHPPVYHEERMYNAPEQKFNLSTFTNEQMRANYSAIADKIASRKNGIDSDFAKQPLEVREKYLPVTDIREREMIKEAETEFADYVGIFKVLRKADALTLDQYTQDILQFRIGYTYDLCGNRKLENKSATVEQEMYILDRIASNERLGQIYTKEELQYLTKGLNLQVNWQDDTYIENTRQVLAEDLNRRLRFAINTYISETFADIAESINSYEARTNDMDETRMLEEGNRRTKMQLVLDSKEHLANLGYSQSEIDNICDQIESKLALNQTYQASPEEIKANHLEFLDYVLSDREELRKEIENIEGTKLSDEDFEQKACDADYLLTKTGLDLDEYDLTKEEFQTILNKYKS